MTISYVTAAQPLWVMINNIGTLAGGSKLYTKSSLTFLPKAVYSDSSGSSQAAYTNPIIFNENGTRGPFFFIVDTDNPDDQYFLQAFDRNDNPLWTVNNFTPGDGGGGGGNVTNYISLQNYIANSVFIDHCNDTASPTNTTNLVIAPSNHKGFTPADVNPVVGTYGVVGPDIRFLKSNTLATDQITFETFALADNPLTGDVTPVQYLRYRCTVLGAGETYKCFQFPITQKVKNLSGQAMNFQCWAKSEVSPTTLTLYSRQYYGNGSGATSESILTRVQIGTLNLTSTWTLFKIPFNFPLVGANTLGSAGFQTDDDAVYLQIETPLSVTCDISFTKVALYLGAINPDLDFDTYDEIDSINLTPRTGDIRTSLHSYIPQGWVAMNDGSIGNVGSGATNRANKDTFQLYKTIWDNIIDTWAPVSTGRGASAIADFLANKTLTLPRTLGRALAGYGAGSGLTSRALGEFLGAETHTLSIAEMPAHDHPGSTVSMAIGGFSGGGGNAYTNVGATPQAIVTVASQGGGTAHTIMQPTAFQNIFIKL